MTVVTPAGIAPSQPSMLSTVNQKFQTHVIGRISAAAQVPLHFITILFTVAKMIVAFPARAALQNWKGEAVEATKKDMVVALAIISRLKANLKNIFTGSDTDSPTFKSALYNVVLIPFMSTVLTEDVYYDYRNHKKIATEADAEKHRFTSKQNVVKDKPFIVEITADHVSCNLLDTYNGVLGVIAKAHPERQRNITIIVNADESRLDAEDLHDIDVVEN